MKPEKTFQGQITDKDQLNKNRNQFYGQEGAGPNIDVNKLYQAKAAHQGSAPGVPEEIQNSKEFKYNQKKFYGNSTST